jgi:hypothetical protein
VQGTWINILDCIAAVIALFGTPFNPVRHLGRRPSGDTHLGVIIMVS